MQGSYGIAMVESKRETGPAIETLFYITSSTDYADHLAAVIRQHWALPNSLHWVMDMVTRDDDLLLSLITQ